MGDQLFDLFGDTLRTQSTNVLRQPLFNDENRGKVGVTGPIKPNEPVKKGGETKKKSFLSNTGLALQSRTPAQKICTAFSPKIGANIASFSPIYHEANEQLEELEFSYPRDENKNFKSDVIDYLFSPMIYKQIDDIDEPTYDKFNAVPEFDKSYEDNFFTDDMNDEPAPYQDDDLPDLF